MKLGDIIALAKLGYKKEDIKELISLADTAEGPDSTGTENGPEELPAGEPEERSQEPDKEPEKSADDHKTEQDLIALQNQITDLKKQLENAQKQNINKNNSDHDFNRPSDQDVLNEVIRNFM